MRSVNGVPILDRRALGNASRRAILKWQTQKKRFFETLGAPDLIQAGDFGTWMAQNDAATNVLSSFIAKSARTMSLSSLLRRRTFQTRENAMEELKIALKRARATWDYDEEADALYVSVGDAQAGIALERATN